MRPHSADCLLVFLASNLIFDVYEILSKHSKWSQYMKDYKKFVSPLHFSKDPSGEFSKLLNETGFQYIKVETRHERFVYEGLKSYKGWYKLSLINHIFVY